MGTNVSKTVFYCKRKIDCICAFLPFMFTIDCCKEKLIHLLSLGDCHLLRKKLDEHETESKKRNAEKTVPPEPTESESNPKERAAPPRKSVVIIPAKEPKRGDRLVTHHAWIKQSVLTRHYKIFPLKILLSGSDHRQTYRKFSIELKKTQKNSEAADRRGNGSKKKEQNEKLKKLDQDLVYTAHSNKNKSLEMDELDEALDLGKPGIEFAARSNGVQSVYVVAGYPDNLNPNLSRSTQRKLDQMSPKEFLTYVLNDLSLEERESLMIDERQRRKTFLVNWPHEGHLSGEKMAQSGFYCVGSDDRVQCVFCRGSLHRWSEDDNPMTEHAKAFAFCRFVKSLDCGNKEYRNNLLIGDELKHLCPLPNLAVKKNRDGSVSVDSNLVGICTQRAEVVKYAVDSARLRTFARWPARNPIEATALCEAGFYYTGFDDQVRCFYCSGSLKEWKSGDEPFEEHARWFPDCAYLLQIKGERYVDEVHARTEDSKKCKRETILELKQVSEKKQQLCLDESMVEVCAKLGHDIAIIREAVEINGGPFRSIKEHLEAVYVLEDCNLPRAERQAKAAPKKMIVAEEDLQRLSADASPSQDVIDSAAAPKGSCITCYKKTLQSVAAHYIGLPCGHMLYCDKCNQDEMKRSMGTTYKHKCAYRGCGATLSATFKTFYA